LYGLDREKSYDKWLLKLIQETTGSAETAAPFTSFRTFLSFSNLLIDLTDDEFQGVCKILQLHVEGLFSGLQLQAQKITDKSFCSFLLWNQTLDKSFHILLDINVPQVQNESIMTETDSIGQLKSLMTQVFQTALLPVDAIRFINGDCIWQSAEKPGQIMPQNHYVHRHMRSALDRMQASQSLVVQSQGDFKDVRDYWSDGQNEIQLAGSSQLTDVILDAIRTGHAGELAALTDTFHSFSMDTTYFHALESAHIDFNRYETPQRLIAWFILLSCTGVSALNLQSLMDTFLSTAEHDLPPADQLQRLFCSPSFKPLAKLLSFRHQNAAFHPLGAQISLQSTPSIWAVQRFSPDTSQQVLCLANVSSKTQEITLTEEDIVADKSWQSIFGERTFQAGKPCLLQPYEGLWLIESQKREKKRIKK
jgi:hypothetical protein